MGKWKEVKLKDVIQVINGRAYKKAELLDQGKYRVLRVGNLFTNNSWYYSNLELDEDKYCDKGDLIYAWSASFGPRIWNEEKVIYHYHIWKMVCNEKVLDKNYAFQFLEWDKDLMQQEHSRGVGMFHLTKTAIENRKFFLPPLPEQQRIVAKLDGLFSKIDKAISLLEANLQHTQALMGSVLDEEFGRLDCEWYKLQDVTKIVGGGTPKTAISEYWADEIIWLSPTDLPPIGVISTVKDSTKKISRLGLQKSSAKLLPKGTVVYSSRASIGKIAITECELSTNQGFTNFIPNEGLNNVYLAKTLKHFTPKIEALSNSTTFKEVSKTALKKFEIPVPDYKTQLELSQLFSEYQNLIDKSVETQTQKLNHLKALKSSLLDQAFKGEL
ncbi:restriction endonuclease subunit S [Mangrovimonas spongiae]|uniref:restriction endonuclease subunit S n=1 Tax=Mangrovimonas spongiae TaxID=2494697 RepID=UPI00131555AA|nr:restriction endonuclease subunit S [Mangrovimonas spongiae]